MSRRARTLTTAIVVLLAVSAFAQFRRVRGTPRAVALPANTPYDGRFTFVRVKYKTAEGGYWYQSLPAWIHGYPVAEQNLMRIMTDISDLDPHVDDINVTSFEDPGFHRCVPPSRLGLVCQLSLSSTSCRHDGTGIFRRLASPTTYGS